METKYIGIGDNDWGLIVCYDYDMRDWDDMWAIMRSFGLSSRKAEEAIRVLSHPNNGMSISNYDIRMSVIFISNATSEDEWWNSIQHELNHVAVAIIDYFGEPYWGEPASYLSGHLLQRVIKEVGYPCYK